ncbi:MAG: C40 family peptidase [Bacteroidales bacterium]
MEKYICENVFVPLRSGPSHRSEMLSQLLFGEKYMIIDQIGHWIKVEADFDNYQGWIDLNHAQHSVVQDDSSGHVLNKNLLCYKNDKTKMVLEPGCEIFSPDFEKKIFFAGENMFTAGRDFSKSFISTSDSLTETAMKFINSPYIWGGRIPSGIDCSGLTQLVYKIHGIRIWRNSWHQAEMGTGISFIDEAKPGDLVFFDDDRGRISHVGMILSQGLVIHASGRVRIDSIDHQGIFRQETGKYTHHLRTIKRLIP